LVHGLVFWEFYSAHPYALLDPGLGTLSLLGAVLGGLVSAAYVARQVGALTRPWADAAAVPMLLAIGLGKLALVLGGSGQGTPFDGAWALAFAGSGPWVSAYPELPSHPSQVYEGLWLLMGIPVISALSGWRRGPERTRPLDWEGWTGEGWLFVGALVWFLFGRLLVGFTWRDEAVVGPLNVEQALALAVLLATLFVRAVTRLRLAVSRT
jgi:prolipoprotein diacylglyceryltransferase